MLSYQHAFHAGNLADVQKHALLAFVLDYMTRKDKPVSYIETHAGRGLYWLGSAEAAKTGEAAQGIARLEAAFPPGHPYRERLDEARGMYGADAYPGSPLIAALGLREGDRLHLAELHPQEHAALQEALGSWGAHIRREDGFAMALALTPPTPRRGLMLVDPPYEVKEDYDRIPKLFAQIARKWNVGVLMLWYPILRDAPHAPMLTALMRQHEGALRHEVRFPPAREGHRMVGSGMFVVNPPYGLSEEAARLSALFSRLR
ncbi:23S rRNA (adenine(2030)-N(6))-methyltransferase RlmJ [Pseudogemmobacter humi]|uniref:Ribosomal RNA large subunit methyltransferase J n=1 Tax=Pseudogemmobacter humi TaxID=2483812 RepID=A0A3P5X839_9RHOB|nr:23S rRNA (adenine(2030)-N(6))-methyltransferase RlmJ [Pseudogemmobacter humi]VDC30761.1 Ribosomal RNA large subunit methyltransferase J [Pseudogemmobacter humi]